jgi:hypothetical protein
VAWARRQLVLILALKEGDASYREADEARSWLTKLERLEPNSERVKKLRMEAGQAAVPRYKIRN